MNEQKIRIKQYEQAADEKVSLGGIRWERKWDVCVQCDSREEAERVRAALTMKHEPTTGNVLVDAYHAMQAKKEAAQQEQEPVASVQSMNGLLIGYMEKMLPEGTPLYATPQRCPNCESLEAQNSELDARLAQPEQEPVAHSIVAGALFDFMGWLTTRRERLVLSGADDAAPAADAIKHFARMRSLSINDAQVQKWQEHLATPPRREWVGLTEEEVAATYGGDLNYRDGDYLRYARAIEAKLKN